MVDIERDNKQANFEELTIEAGLEEFREGPHTT
jgi:hypothetical protein